MKFVHTNWRRLLASPVLLLALVPAARGEAERGVMVRLANLYLAPGATSQRIAEIERGREVVVLEKSHDWLHVMANLERQKDVTGWILDKGVVRASTADGDRILFGEAVDSEWEASRRGGRRGADRDAMRLYYAVYEYFPKSPLAGEALYRSADIRWQLEAEDVLTRPSSKERNPLLKAQFEEDYMRMVRKKFPGTKWADLAAYHLIQNKLCGDWAGLAKCPERETDIYQKYAKEHPNSPKAAEALYQAAWRQAALVQIYKDDNNPGRSASAKAKASQFAQEIASRYAETDWGPRAQRLLFYLQQNIAVRGQPAE